MEKGNQKILESTEIIKLESTPQIKRVRFNGIIYRRYPQAKNFSDRNYYRCSISDKRKGFSSLHRDIWKFYKGEIPSGFHIHHIDENTENNDIGNFEALPPIEHHKRHTPTAKQRQAIAYRKSRKYALEKAKQSAIDWHRSPEGREWHSRQAKESFKRRELVKKLCEHCNKNYFTKSASSKDRFCSKKCQSAWRRAQGLDNVQSLCLKCGKSFEHNKYKKNKYCSNSCSKKHSWEARRQTQSGN